MVLFSMSVLPSFDADNPSPTNTSPKPRTNSPVVAVMRMRCARDPCCRVAMSRPVIIER